VAVSLPDPLRLKLDLMFDGVRYTEALTRAAAHSFPNFFPHRIEPGEPDPTGTGRAPIPYMMVTGDDVHCRVRTNRESPYWVEGSEAEGYLLRHAESEAPVRVSFEPAWGWLAGRTQDGLPAIQAGVSLHGDMAVVNVAPGCQYFQVPRVDGVAMQCTFCTYGAPDARIRQLGQEMSETDVPEAAYRRLQEVLGAALAETPIATIYLVGGSLLDPHAEGRRFIELARRVQEVVQRRVPVTCGSGALPEESQRVLHGEGLADAVCFNLEVWSEPLFRRVCPGKDRFVGFHRWIAWLEHAVRLWGRGRAYTALVAGLELAPELGLVPDEAVQLALRGAEDLIGRGIIPVYSLYWPPPGRGLPVPIDVLRDYFERLHVGYHAIRRTAGLAVWEGFMSQRSAFMQVECDFDRSLAA
jgi:hypothetical protein